MVEVLPELLTARLSFPRPHEKSCLRQFSLSLLRLVPNPIRRRFGGIVRIGPKVLRKVEGPHVAVNE